MVSKLKGWIPIQEIRLYYLSNCDNSDPIYYYLSGERKSIKPTLTGFISYWRNFQKKNPNIVITYKSEQ